MFHIYQNWDEMAAELADLRVGLIAHQASIDAAGLHTAERLPVVRLFGPEHGYFGWGAAGEKVLDAAHPFLGIPVHSLYGEHRRPPQEWIADLDVLVFDLQDLGFRCYTFVSTLRLVLEAASECGVCVVVLDRPIPLPDTVDGPMYDPSCESFVNLVNMPLSYAMTPAEAAIYLQQDLALDVDLRVLPNAEPFELRVPPSPAIRSWMTCATYLTTVFCEALVSMDCDRAGLIPFQTLTAPWLDPASLPRLPGAELHRHVNQKLHPGVRIRVTDLASWRPVEASVHLLAALPTDLAWKDARTDFFDQLYGTSTVREMLLDGVSAEAVIASWQPGLDRFRACREQVLLPQSDRVL